MIASNIKRKLCLVAEILKGFTLGNRAKFGFMVNPSNPFV